MKWNERQSSVQKRASSFLCHHPTLEPNHTEPCNHPHMRLHKAHPLAHQYSHHDRLWRRLARSTCRFDADQTGSTSPAQSPPLAAAYHGVGPTGLVDMKGRDDWSCEQRGEHVLVTAFDLPANRKDATRRGQSVLLCGSPAGGWSCLLGAAAAGAESSASGGSRHKADAREGEGLGGFGHVRHVVARLEMVSGGGEVEKAVGRAGHCSFRASR